MNSATCATTAAFDSSTLVTYFLLACFLVGLVEVLHLCGKGVLWVLRSIYRFLAMVGRFVCGTGKPAEVAGSVPAAPQEKEEEEKEEEKEEEMQMRADPRLEINRNHHEDEEENAGATDDDSHGSLEAEAEKKEEEEEEVQDGRETGCADSPGMFNNPMETLVCCRLYGLLIDLTHEHGREKHSELALSLPRGLSYQEFGKSFAHLLRKGGLEKMNSTQASPYYQLYRAYDREEGKCMPMIRRARLLEL